MNGWIGLGLVVMVYFASIVVFLLLARRGPLVDDEPIGEVVRPPPEDYVRLVPRDLFALALAVLLAACAPAAAQQPPKACGPHDHITGWLEQNFQEEARSGGLQSNGHLIQLYASSTGATWTIVSTRPNGLTCIVAAGKWWQELPRELPIGTER